MALPQSFSDFLEKRPEIKVVGRDAPEFNATKEVFFESPDVPLVILQPSTADEVADLVRNLSKNSVPFVIRAGGHDPSSRSVAQDAVQIDIRALDSVTVAADKRTARIGGGILTQRLLDVLGEEELMTAVGNSGTVGWCSWAMNGGYGIMAGKYGLGCDQIVGAKVVLADGRTVDADERLLKGLRGAGPAFGVIVELEIKVYPLTDITSGFIACDGSELSAALTRYFDNCRSLIDEVKALPRELYFQPMILTPAGAPLPGWVVQFVWAGPASEEQARWLKKIVEISPGGQPVVASIAPAKYVQGLMDMIDPHVMGGESRTVSMRSLVPSSAAAAVIAKQAPLITPEWGAMFIHMVHGESVLPDVDHPESVFASREIHLMVEILGVAYRDEMSKVPAIEWCRKTHDALVALDGVMDYFYLPLTQSSALTLETTYKKEELEFLKGLKKELDPKNIFFNLLPLAA